MNKVDKYDLLDIKLFNIIENEILTDIEKEKQLLELAYLNNIDIKKIYQRYFWLKQMDINPNVIHLRENHKIIYEIFGEYTKMLNDEKIEYYYTSGILSYLLVDKPLERYHHDLDIFINMNDLQKLESICKNYNFSFYRKLGERGDGTKRVMLKMYYKDIFNIPITVFMYVKEVDLSVIQKDYFTDENGKVSVKEGDTQIFIYPGYKFKCLDGLITNFHLPESTLLMLVSALAGKEYIMNAYNEAVKQKYRFFSFGDAMFIK